MRSYGRFSVETSREDKVLFPAGGITKGALIDYYEAAWDRMKPHLRDRPLVMQRFPDGIGGEGFYQKELPDYFPDRVGSVSVQKRQGGRQRLVVCNAKATLALLADQACITPHLWLSRADRPTKPDQLIVDLDPAGEEFERVRRAARWCRDLLDEQGLFSVLKTTGSRGLHVVVPLRRGPSFDAVRDFAKGFAQTLAARHPDALTTEQRKSKRRGRLYLDVGRNAYAQTAVAPYAVRALEGAPVAAPITWSELDDASLDARSFTLRTMPKRLAGPDPWAEWRRHARALPA